MSGSYPTGTVPPPAPSVAEPPAKQRVRITLTDPADASTIIGVQAADQIEIERDLSDISGRFSFTVYDVARAAAAGTMIGPGASGSVPLRQGMHAAMTLDGVLMMVGRVDAVDAAGDATSQRITLRGRDLTCALVDCAAAPTGPTEYRNQTLTQIATAVCAPFGIAVATQTDVGAPFAVASLRQADTAMAFLDSLAKQRSTLLVSDGVGNLLLTQGGASAGAAPIVRGGNIHKYHCTIDWSKRFSDYYVRGQTNPAGYASGGAGMSYGTAPGATPADPGYAQPTTLMLGHAQDPAIAEYRPTVRITRSQSGMATTQDQADWALRVAQGESDRLVYTVLDWHAGPAGALWMPNSVVLVQDPLVGLAEDMLIAGAKYKWSNAEGATTELRVVGLTAYDQTNLAARRRQAGAATQPLASSYSQLTAP